MMRITQFTVHNQKPNTNTGISASCGKRKTVNGERVLHRLAIRRSALHSVVKQPHQWWLRRFHMSDKQREEFEATPDAPWAPDLLAAVKRFMTTPLKRKHAVRAARQSLAFVELEG